MNETYKTLTTIKLNKLKFKKVFKKSHFIFQKVIFPCLKKKIFLKKVDFFIIFGYTNVQNFRNIRILLKVPKLYTSVRTIASMPRRTRFDSVQYRVNANEGDNKM